MTAGGESGLILAVNNNLLTSMRRNYLKVEDLNAHFCDNPVDIEDLLKQADTLVRRYLTTEAAERAMFSKNPSGINAFVNGAAWRDPAIVETDTNASPKASYGDQVLGNTLLRMRDSMLHYEFHHAIADGDIGRAMNVMAVSKINSPIYISSFNIKSGLDFYLHWFGQG